MDPISRIKICFFEDSNWIPKQILNLKYELYKNEWNVY